MGHDSNERGSWAFLESFCCEAGHRLGDLSPAQEGAILESALDWIAGALDAMESARWDGLIDRYREEGF